MRNIIALASAAAMALSAGAASASALDGEWMSPTKHGVIQLYDCGQGVCGRIVSSDDLQANPDMRDLHNKDAALQSRRIKGLVMVTGMKGGPTEWSGGSLYDPVSGNTYHGSVTLKNASTLDLKGCIIVPLCRTQTWTKVR